jgi:hypothetical protein
LNVRQQRFVDLFLSGIPAGRAYEQAGYSVSRGTADTSAARLLRNVHVSNAISKAREDLERSSQVSRQDLVAYLEAVLMTPVGALNAASPLVQEATLDTRGDANLLSVKMLPKLEAAKLLCKIQGWDSPEPEKHTVDSRVAQIIRLVRTRSALNTNP